MFCSQQRRLNPLAREEQLAYLLGQALVFSKAVEAIEGHTG